MFERLHVFGIAGIRFGSVPLAVFSLGISRSVIPSEAEGSASCLGVILCTGVDSSASLGMTSLVFGGVLGITIVRLG